LAQARQQGGLMADEPRVSFASLGYLSDVQQTRRAPQKGRPAMLEREDKRKAKTANGDTFRAAVWKRDQGKCRATGVQLVKSGTTDAKKLGEVDHSIPRSLAPERVYDVGNGLLLQKFLNRLRKVVCRNAPEHKYFDYTGPDDRSLPQTFTWRDDDGTVTKTRIG
jgi:hypothetical protein